MISMPIFNNLLNNLPFLDYKSKFSFTCFQQSKQTLCGFQMFITHMTKQQETKHKAEDYSIRARQEQQQQQGNFPCWWSTHHARIFRPFSCSTPTIQAIEIYRYIYTILTSKLFSDPLDVHFNDEHQSVLLNLHVDITQTFGPRAKINMAVVVCSSAISSEYGRWRNSS